jgi:hypothetical protein
LLPNYGKKPLAPLAIALYVFSGCPKTYNWSNLLARLPEPARCCRLRFAIRIVHKKSRLSSFLIELAAIETISVLPSLANNSSGFAAL